MNPKLKKGLLGLGSILLVVALIAIAPISRLVYSVYDAGRTRDILQQLENEANAQDGPTVNDFHKQAYFMSAQDTDGGKTVNRMDLLVLTSDNAYELTYYERVEDGSTSYTSEYFHMTGTYTRDGNMLTVEPGIGVLSQNPGNSGFTHYNAQFLTAEEAAGDKTRDEVYAMKYSSKEIALMKDGSFAVGGTSDSKEELGAPEGRKVYTDSVLQGRVTYKTLVTLDDGTYILYSQATNSNNVEQTTGSLFGFGTYEIKDTDKGIVPDEAVPEETYDIVTGSVGRGYMYANNNGSHMQFDLQSASSFSQWLATSFNAVTPTFYVTESGFTIKMGALKTVVEPWGMYIPAAESEEEPGSDAPTEPGQNVELEIASSVEGKPFILNLNADGTLLTGWTNYEQTMQEGKWSVNGGELVLEMEYSYQVVKNADGSVDITINYGQMGEKTYTMTAEQFASLQNGGESAAPAGSIELELESSVEGKPFVLNLNADGTLLTGWTNYEQTMQEGKWSVNGGELILEMEYSYQVVKNADGSVDITVNYGQMGEKTYTMSAEVAEQFAAMQGGGADGVELEVASSVEGKPFVLNLNADGTLLTGWTNYEQTMQEGKWSVNGGELVLEMEYSYQVVKNADGSIDITVNYGQMGEKTYTMSVEVAEQFAVMQGGGAGGVELEIASSVEGKPFVLNLNADGTLLTGWTNYEQTMQEGKWSVNGGDLLLEMEYSYRVVKNADGSVDITINYGQMGEKTYTMTAEQATAIFG